jgi:hypothetical protein
MVQTAAQRMAGQQNIGRCNKRGNLIVKLKRQLALVGIVEPSRRPGHSSGKSKPDAIAGRVIYGKLSVPR